MSKIMLEGKLSKRIRIIRIKASKIFNFKLVTARPGRAPQLGRAGGLANAVATVMHFLFFI
jgi:hypothetical protein